jgi:hypothetical protein
MKDWLIELDCIWKSQSGEEPCTIKIGIPTRNRAGPPCRAQFKLPLLAPIFTTYGLDLACIKTSIAIAIEGMLSAYDASLMDREGVLVDIRALIPIRIDDFASVRRAPPPGHAPDSKWAIDRACQWVSEEGTAAFRLKFSNPRRVSPIKTLYAMSANHPLLGELMLRDSRLGSVHFFIGTELPEFAKWNRARILDVNGEALDFEALADEVVGRTLAGKQAYQEKVQSLLREFGERTKSFSAHKGRTE